MSTGAIAALNCPALWLVWLVRLVWLVWLVWLVDDELTSTLEDELLDELPPQPDSSTSVAAVATLLAIHDLGLARDSLMARL
ncbi:MAG: hypothetical protein ACTHMY_10860 [Solirubrobacteraceae bacterium]